jgi:glycosyltransferase involved in cell wall biosynthesis
MNCFNAEEFLNEALQSVLNQTYSNWELIFWDNQSTDSSKDIFNFYMSIDNRFKYYLALEHTNLGQARNMAIDMAEGDLIAFLDCDDIWLPEKLSKQVPYFDDSSIGMVICDTIFFNSNREIKQLYKNNPPPQGDVVRNLLRSYFISLETVVIRKKYLGKMTALFDDRFQVIEEYDFFIRFLTDCKLAYVDEVLSKWRVHNKSWTWSRPELFPKELKIFLQKIVNEYPQFSIDYKKELGIINDRVMLLDAMQLWSKGDVLSARMVFRKFINLKYLILFILSFLPYKFFDAFNKWRVGLKG